jgi:hypothetical protein
MSFESDVLGQFVPNVILSQIFSQLLSFEDISRFDIAMCNNTRRPLFLECIGSDSCIQLGDKVCNFSCHAMRSRKIINPRISWLLIRSMKTRHLRCNRVTYNIAEKIGEFGDFLQWLTIDHARMVDKSIIEIVEYSPHLQHLDLNGCREITDYGIIQIAENCPNLRSLNLLGYSAFISDYSVTKIAEGCPYLEMNISDTSIIKRGMF